MEKIILQSIYNFNTYCILESDKSEWDDFIGNRHEEFLDQYYDAKTGEPLTDDIKELEDAIDNWNPEKFEKYWNKLDLTSELEYVISN